MRKLIGGRLTLLATLAAGMVLSASPAHAVFKLRIESGAAANTVLIEDQVVVPVLPNTNPDLNPLLGGITTSTVVNGYSVSFAAGTSKPILPNTPTTASMDLSTFTVSATAAGSIVFTLSDTGFVLAPNPTVANLMSLITANTPLPPGGSTLQFQVWVNPDNVLFSQTGTLLTNSGVLPITATMSDTKFASASLTSPFSMTLKITYTTTGPGQSISADGGAGLSTLPEPMTLATAFAGLPVLCLMVHRARRRSRQQRA